jgi:hypothetical protein
MTANGYVYGLLCGKVTNLASTNQLGNPKGFS